MLSYLTSSRLRKINEIIAELYTETETETETVKAYSNFLNRMRELIFFEKANVFFYVQENGVFQIEEFAQVDWKDSHLEQYLEFYYILDDVLPLISVNNTNLFRSTDVFNLHERRKTKYYKELVRPAGLHYSLEGNIFTNNCYYGGVGFYRSEDKKDFSNEELEIIRFMRPHLSNVAKKHYELKNNRFNIVEFLPLLSNFNNVSIVIFDNNLEVIFSNLSSKQNINKDVEADLVVRSRKFCTILKEAHFSKPHIEAKIELPKNSFYMELSYVKLDKHENEHRFIVMIYDISNMLIRTLMKFKDTHGLTQREFEILRLVLSGLNNNEICSTLHISLPTVKKHLTSTYEKLGLKGKHQLINILT